MTNPFDLGPHAVFIWASYAAMFGTLGVVTVWAVWERTRLSAQLARLEAERGHGPAGSDSPEEVEAQR